MKILIIGATGFIGRHVVSHLLKGGHDVAILHRGKTAKPKGWDVAAFLGDRADLQEAGARAWGPDVVIDMILSSAKQARTTVEAFAGVAQRVVAISSGDVYRAMAVVHRLDNGPVEPIPLTEESPLRTHSQPYPPERLAALRVTLPWLDDEYDKIQVEQAISSHPDLPATILRLPMVYGPEDMFHRFYPTIRPMLDGRAEISQDYAYSRWKPCRGYVENVAEAIALAATSEKATGRIYNVADPEPYSEGEWAAEIGQAVGWKGRVVAPPHEAEPTDPRLAPTNFAQHLFMDSTRIRRELGYSESVPLGEAIRRTVEWEKAHPGKYAMQHA
jgi:nucleoside-diphosphate-sugar epimerase